jgi:hypothetical protein
MSKVSRPCEICGQPIEADRVELLADTRLCGEHARQIAKYGGEFVLTGTQASLAKGGSLKRNYGDVSVAKRRNAEGLRRLKEEHERSNEGA